MQSVSNTAPIGKVSTVRLLFLGLATLVIRCPSVLAQTIPNGGSQCLP